jgi:hypothetical protein
VLGSASKGVSVCEEEAPAVLLRLTGELIHATPRTPVECQVVQAWAQTIVGIGDECGRLLQNNVCITGLPTAAGRPSLKRLVSELEQQPPPTCRGSFKVRHP